METPDFLDRFLQVTDIIKSWVVKREIYKTIIQLKGGSPGSYKIIEIYYKQYLAYKNTDMFYEAIDTLEHHIKILTQEHLFYPSPEYITIASRYEELGDIWREHNLPYPSIDALDKAFSILSK